MEYTIFLGQMGLCQGIFRRGVSWSRLITGRSLTWIQRSRAKVKLLLNHFHVLGWPSPVRSRTFCMSGDLHILNSLRKIFKEGLEWEQSKSYSGREKEREQGSGHCERSEKYWSKWSWDNAWMSCNMWSVSSWDFMCYQGRIVCKLCDFIIWSILEVSWHLSPLALHFYLWCQFSL